MNFVLIFILLVLVSIGNDSKNFLIHDKVKDQDLLFKKIFKNANNFNLGEHGNDWKGQFVSDAYGCIDVAHV